MFWKLRLKIVKENVIVYLIYIYDVITLRCCHRDCAYCFRWYQGNLNYTTS